MIAVWREDVLLTDRLSKLLQELLGGMKVIVFLHGIFQF